MEKNMTYNYNDWKTWTINNVSIRISELSCKKMHGGDWSDTEQLELEVLARFIAERCR